MTLLESAWQRRGSENLVRREDTSPDKVTSSQDFSSYQLLRKERSFTKWRPTTMESCSYKLTMRLPLFSAIVLEELIQSKVECEHPVPPSEGAAVSPVEKKSSQCKACSFTNKDATKVRNHQQAHYVKKCPNCQKFFKVSSFQRQFPGSVSIQTSI